MSHFPHILADDDWVKLVGGAFVLLFWIIGAIAKSTRKKKQQAPQRSWEEILRDLSAGQQGGTSQAPSSPARTPSLRPQPGARSAPAYLRNAPPARAPGGSSQRTRQVAKQGVRTKAPSSPPPRRQSSSKRQSAQRPVPPRIVPPPPLPVAGQPSAGTEII